MAEVRKGHDYGKNMDDDRYGRELHHTRKRDSDNGESYQEIKSKLNSGQISEKDAAREMKNAKFESAEEISDAFRNHLISSSEAQSKARSLSLEHKQSVFSVQRLNEQLKTGKVSAKEGAYQGISLIAKDSNGKIKAVTLNRMKNRVIPKYESLTQKRLAEKLRHGGYKMMKLTAGKAIKGTFKGASGLVSMAIPKNIGDHSDPIEGELMDSGSNTLHSGLTRTTSFAGSTFNAIKNRINIHKQKTSRTITQKDLLKSQNARTLRGRKKADEAIAKKISHGADTRYKLSGSNRFSKASAKNIAKGVGKGALKAGKEVKNAGASAGRFATNQVSKITTDSLGQTDETVSSIGHASKSAAKLTAKGTKTTFKAARTTAKETAKATKATVNTTRKVVSAVVTAITTLVNTVASAVVSIAGMLPVLIPIFIAIFIVVLIVVFIATCFSGSPTILGNMTADFAYYNDTETFLEAERLYSEAEQELYQTYSENANIDTALAALSEEYSKNLTPDNTSFTASSTTSAYHNPYVLASYLCVKYGPNWKISDVENEWNYDNEDSLIYKQYSLNETLARAGENTGKIYLYGDFEKVQIELISTAKSMADKGVPYCTGGEGMYMLNGFPNYVGSYPCFDCSGFTRWVYYTATGGAVDLSTSPAYSSNGTVAGQWFEGEALPRPNSYSEFIDSLEIGDLIFFNYNEEQDNLPGHVGIYIGDGQMIDAHSTGSTYYSTYGEWKPTGEVVTETLGEGDRANYSAVRGARRYIEKAPDDDDDWSSEDSDIQWIVVINFTNNGMHNVIVGDDDNPGLLTDDDDLETYLAMLYYYGAGDEDSVSIMEEYWPKAKYATHDDNVTSFDEFCEVNGVTPNFDIDKTYSGGVSLGSGNGYYIDGYSGAMFPLGYKANITSPFGWRVLSGVKEFHTGVDFGGSSGDEVYAAFSGSVTSVHTCSSQVPGSSSADAWRFSDGNDACGNYIGITGTATINGKIHTVFVRYQHLRDAPVYNLNDSISQGDVVGYVGATGNATGVHFHVYVLLDGQNVDPMIYLWPNYSST